MSWWTENRKKVALLGGLLAAPWALPALGGLLGLGGATAAGTAGAAAGAGAAGAATGALGTGTSLVGTGLAGSGALGTGGSLAGTGLGAAGAAAPAGFMNAGLLAANSPNAFAAMSAAPTALESAMAMGGKVMKGVNMAGQGLQAASMFAPQQGQKQPPMQPPPQPMQPPPPIPSGYGEVNDAPPGIDPNQWAAMSPEQKKALLAQRGMA